MSLGAIASSAVVDPTETASYQTARVAITAHAIAMAILYA